MMAALYDLNLIRFFDFYLLLLFFVSLYLRVQQYRAAIGLVRSVPGRWPKLFELVRQHRMVFLTWTTLLPAILALTLSVSHMLLCRLVWPHANLNVARLLELWPAIPAVALCGLLMVGFDLVATFWVGQIDRRLLEKYFDQAEYWLRSWVAPVVRVFTLGRINPRKMVAVEVQKALLDASKLLNTTLWWVAVQVGLRVAFGLSIWLTYAVGQWVGA